MRNYYTDYKMVKTFDLDNITIDKTGLRLNPGDLSGDLIRGGTIERFASTGIRDIANGQTVLVENGQVTLGNIPFKLEDGKLTIQANVIIEGALEATNEVIYHQKYEKQYLQFSNPDGDVGTGLLWTGDAISKQIVFRNNPNRFFLSENVDLPKDRSYMIGRLPVVTETGLGNSIVDSNLQTLGHLKELNVGGKINIGDQIFYNPVSERLGIGTDMPNGVVSVFDATNGVEIVLTGNELGRGVVGTYNAKGLDIVTDNQTRLSVSSNGDITLGLEQRDATVTRVYGKLSVGVKNPTEQFEVAGNIRWANRLFAVDDQPPTSGTFNKGDIVWNNNPKENAPIGWVCIAGGTPGLWRSWGQING